MPVGMPLDEQRLTQEGLWGGGALFRPSFLL